MAVSNLGRNIPCNYRPKLSLAHIAKKGDRRSAPLSPRENRRPINRKTRDPLASRVTARKDFD